MDELPELEPVTLHECRHTFALLMIAAGVNAEALSAYMGHASVMITLDSQEVFPCGPTAPGRQLCASDHRR